MAPQVGVAAPHTSPAWEDGATTFHVSPCPLQGGGKSACLEQINVFLLDSECRVQFISSPRSDKPCERVPLTADLMNKLTADWQALFVMATKISRPFSKGPHCCTLLSPQLTCGFAILQPTPQRGGLKRQKALLAVPCKHRFPPGLLPHPL